MFVTNVTKIGSLPEKLKSQFLEVVKLHGGDEESEFIRKSSIAPEDLELGEEERTCIQYVSTGDIDRDSEILVPGGAVLTEFRKAPQVLWGHDYDLPPIGKDLWIRTTQKGVLAKTKYATTERANEVWDLKRGGFLKTNSVGFMPIKSLRNGADGWDKLCDKLHSQGYTFDRTKVRRIYTRWVLLEHSDVSVPANINALVVAVSKKKLNISKDLFDQLGIPPVHDKAQYTCSCISCGHTLETDKHCNEIKCPKCGGEMRRAERPGAGRGAPGEEEIKGVIPYKDYGIDSNMEAEWNAGREVREASAEDLMKMSAWYDSGNPEVKGSYKLPHHRQQGKKAVWRGISTGMAVLLGARGGVNVPGGDRKGIYNHLVGHYKQFEKEPPAFRDYSDLELRGLFGDEVWEKALIEIHPALKPYPNEHACRVLSPDGFDRIRRENDRFAPGIHAIWGVKEGQPVKLQSIRFDKNKYTVAQAKTWCSEHDYTCRPFEPATTSRSSITPLKPKVAAKKIELPPKPEIKKIPSVKKVEEKFVRPAGRAEVTNVQDVGLDTLDEEIKQAIGRAKGKV